MKIINRMSVIAIITTAMSMTGSIAHAEREFLDVPKTHWAYSYITELANDGIINGVGDDMYEPESTLTRGQFIKLLTCALDDYKEDENYFPVFSDTPEGVWYTPYTTCGVNSNIVDRSEPFFYPENEMTRGEAAVWMIKGLGLEAQGECSFSDITDTRQRKAVGEAQNQGLISGYDDGTFKPDNTLTRAEAAALIKRLISNDIASYTLREDAANEVVLKDTVKTAVSGTKNKISDIDETKHTVTISDPDATITGLRKNDILYIPDCPEISGGLLVKITGVKKSGGNVVLSCASPKIEEAVESIDISTVVSARAEDFDNEGTAVITNIGSSASDYRSKASLGLDGVSSAGTASRSAVRKADNTLGGDDSEKASKSTSDVDFDAEGDLTIGLDRNGVTYAAEGKVTGESKLHYETDTFADKDGLYASIDLELNVIADMKFSGTNLDTDFYVYTNADSLAKVVSGYSKGVSQNMQIPLPDCDIPVAGPLKVNVKSYLVMNAEGKFEVEATTSISDSVGCKFEDGEFSKWNKPKVSSSLEANAEGSIEAGPKIDITLALGKCKLIGIDGIDLVAASAECGVGANGKASVNQETEITDTSVSYSGNQNTPDENDIIHNCYICFEGKLYFYDQFSAGLSEDINEFLKNTVGKELKYESEKYKHDISPWHASIGPWSESALPEFELKECPHRLVPIFGHITDKETHEKIVGATVRVNDDTARTDADGSYKIYAEPGIQNLSADAEEYKPASISGIILPFDKGVTVDVSMEPDKIKISGYISDSENGNAIAGAEVRVGDEAASTVQNGYYEIFAGEGSYTVQVTAEGYKDYSGEVNLTEDMQLDIRMQPEEAWKTAYAEFLKSHKNDQAFGSFELIYIDDNDIPEIAVSPKTIAHVTLVSLYTYADGEVKEIVSSETGRGGFGGYSTLVYSERGGIFVAGNGGQRGYFNDAVYRLEGAVAVCTDRFTNDTNTDTYYWNDSVVSQSTYENELTNKASSYKSAGYVTSEKITESNINSALGL